MLVANLNAETSLRMDAVLKAAARKSLAENCCNGNSRSSAAQLFTLCRRRWLVNLPRRLEPSCSKSRAESCQVHFSNRVQTAVGLAANALSRSSSPPAHLPTLSATPLSPARLPPTAVRKPWKPPRPRGPAESEPLFSSSRLTTLQAQPSRGPFAARSRSANTEVHRPLRTTKPLPLHLLSLTAHLPNTTPRFRNLRL